MSARGTFLMLAPLLLLPLLSTPSSALDNEKKTGRDWEYLDNGVVRIGIDKSRGACIGYFAESKTKRNLLNNYDEGRFIQQSYYGRPDGSKWNGKPWVYNPVQGGYAKGKSSRLLKFSRDKKKETISARIEPLSWASGIACPEALMGVTISLEGPLARVRFRMDYTGKDQSVVRDQEMPAVFVDAELPNLVYFESGKLKRRVPGWPNERGKASENWVAYLDDKDWGIGIYTPGTETFTCYRFKGNGKTGPTGSACSYVAPLRRFSLQKGLAVDYEVFLTIGSLAEIRERFASLRRKAAPGPEAGNKRK
ncbi:MAG TPA: hypothetical protein DD471_00965 [Planctomycetes bacterium]|jgi:hypothetical protein|nr:hypothetical protein [Planctomycetota bacterium]